MLSDTPLQYKRVALDLLFSHASRSAVTAVAAAQSTALQQHSVIDCAQVAGPALFGALGIQARDLRLLDWKHAAMYPSALLCRDCALLAALEHIKCIITRDSVLVMGAHSLLGLSGTVVSSDLETRICTKS